MSNDLRGSDIKTTALDLKTKYRVLDAHILDRPAPPEARVMKPTFGPAEPCSPLIFAKKLDMETRLKEVAFDALGELNVTIRDDQAGAASLCQLLATHANDVVLLLDWAGDLLDELTYQDQVLGRFIDRHIDKKEPSVWDVYRRKQHLVNKYPPRLDKQPPKL